MSSIINESTYWGDLLRRVIGIDPDGHVVETKPLSEDEAWQLIEDKFLIIGGGGSLRSYDTMDTPQKLCIMQTANIYWALTKGEVPTGMHVGTDHIDGDVSYRHIDQVDPIVESTMIVVNDAWPSDDDQERSRFLKPYIRKLYNTKVGDATDRRIKLANEELMKLSLEAYDAYAKLIEEGTITPGQVFPSDEEHYRHRMIEANIDVVDRMYQFDHEKGEYVLTPREEYKEKVQTYFTNYMNADDQSGRVGTIYVKIDGGGSEFPLLRAYLDKLIAAEA